MQHALRAVLDAFGAHHLCFLFAPTPPPRAAPVPTGLPAFHQMAGGDQRRQRVRRHIYAVGGWGCAQSAGLAAAAAERALAGVVLATALEQTRQTFPAGVLGPRGILYSWFLAPHPPPILTPVCTTLSPTPLTGDGQRPWGGPGSFRLLLTLPAPHRPLLRALCRRPGAARLQAQPPALVPHRPGGQRDQLPALHRGEPTLRSPGGALLGKRGWGHTKRLLLIRCFSASAGCRTAAPRSCSAVSMARAPPRRAPSEPEQAVSGGLPAEHFDGVMMQVGARGEARGPSWTCGSSWPVGASVSCQACCSRAPRRVDRPLPSPWRRRSC